MRDWDNLRYFLAVASHGTVAGAARELQVSHSTVLRRIEQFETHLNSKLFKRLQRGYELSPAGECLYASSKDIQPEIERVFSEAEGRHDVTAGKLRISQPETGIIDLYPLYAKFGQQHPDLFLEIQSTMEAHNLSQMEVDIAIRLSNSPPDLLIGRCLGDITIRAYASKAYLKRHRGRRNSGNHNWLLWRIGNKNKTERWFEDNIVNPQIVLHTDSRTDLVSAACNGMGVAFLSSHEARRQKNLVPLFDGQIISQYKLWVLTHRDLRHSARVKAFMRFMAENISLD